MTSDVVLISAPALPAEKFAIRTEAVRLRDEALEDAALIGKVENAEQNETCVKIRKRIKGLRQMFESQRQQFKEPVLEFGRQLDRTVKAAVAELEKEDARLEGLEREFILAERERKRQEELAQQRELRRIEDERQAALAQATTETQKQIINETAEALSYAESRPVEITRAKGQSVREDWVIEKINDFQLMKARPDLVRNIDWDMMALKAALDASGSLPGVTARRNIKVQARGEKPDVINV